RLGFTAALLCAAGPMLAVLLPTVALVLRARRPGERDRADLAQSGFPDAAPPDVPGWHLPTVLRDRSFQTISLAFALGLTAQVGFLTHQVAYLSPVIGTVAAGWAVSLTTASAVAGRVVTGLFVDKIDRRAVACGNFLIQIAGTALLVWNVSAAMLYLG